MPSFLCAKLCFQVNTFSNPSSTEHLQHCLRPPAITCNDCSPSKTTTCTDRVKGPSTKTSRMQDFQAPERRRAWLFDPSHGCTGIPGTQHDPRSFRFEAPELRAECRRTHRPSTGPSTSRHSPPRGLLYSGCAAYLFTLDFSCESCIVKVRSSVSQLERPFLPGSNCSKALLGYRDASSHHACVSPDLVSTTRVPSTTSSAARSATLFDCGRCGVETS